MATRMRNATLFSAITMVVAVLGSWTVAGAAVTKDQLVAALKAVNSSYDGTLNVNAYDGQGNITDISFPSTAIVSNISPLHGLPLVKLTLPPTSSLLTFHL